MRLVRNVVIAFVVILAAKHFKVGSTLQSLVDYVAPYWVPEAAGAVWGALGFEFSVSTWFGGIWTFYNQWRNSTPASTPLEEEAASLIEH